MNRMKASMLVVAVVLVLLVVAAAVLFWPKAENVVSGVAHVRTENEKAANGPLPGNVLLYDQEFQESAKYASPGYYPSLNGAEVGDAQRSALYPQAAFGGSFTGPNVVFAYRSPSIYQGATFLNNRRPGELFLLGGDSPAISGPVAPGPYVAKVDPTTGEQIWRTYLDNANVTDHA